jgi:hypothetical protein
LTYYEGEIVRHLLGTALAVALTAVMFFAGAWGYLRLLKLPAAPGPAAALPAGGGSLLGDTSLLLALAALVATAVLAGLLATLRRISPLATGLPGLVLLAWTALYLVNVRQAVQLIPLRGQAFGAGWEALLFNGILGAAGAVLVFPLFIPSRWRATARPRVDRVARETDDYLSAVWPETGPRPQDGSQREAEPALSGTVMSGPAGGYVRPVDTTRVTGASRALRATGSFRAATGSVPRATGSFPATADTSLLGRPYPRGDQ